MTDTPHRVFAYGALKAGGANHRLLRGARFYGRVRTAGRYRMWAAVFPLVRPAEESAPRADRFVGQLAGELYCVDDATLAALDGAADWRLYRRVEVPLLGLRTAAPLCLAFIYEWIGGHHGEPVPRDPTDDLLRWPPRAPRAERAP